MLKVADPGSFSAIYAICSYTDMCYGIDSLVTIIGKRFNLPLFSISLFLFCGKCVNKIKGLLWEGDGFLLLTKRVESGYFAWPRNSMEVRSIAPYQFRWFMQGFIIDPAIHEVIIPDLFEPPAQTLRATVPNFESW